MIAGLWNDRRDPATGELVHNYTMVTMNAEAHPLMSLMHKPERHRETKEILLAHEQDKRSVVPVAQGVWETSLTGTPEAAMATLKLPPVEHYLNAAEDPARLVKLPLEA